MNLLLMLACLSPVLVPKSAGAEIDGVFGSTEWKEAVSVANGPASIKLMHDGANLYVGMLGSSTVMASVHVAAGSEVRILHASDALGEVRYKHDGTTWNCGEKFSFKCRDTDSSAKAIAERKAFFAEKGWIANVTRQGDTRVREYKIALTGLEKARLCIGLYDPNGDKLQAFAPASLTDDGLNTKLVAGWNPKNMRFDFQPWLSLTLGEVNSQSTSSPPFKWRR